MIKKFKRNILNESIKIKDAIDLFNKLEKKFLIVIDKKKRVIGTITDGDLRRSLIKKNFFLSNKISSICNKKFHYSTPGLEKSNYQKMMKQKKIFFLPIIKNNKIISLEIIDKKIVDQKYNHKVFLLAGGKGLRLRPLTKKMPKPMLLIKKERLLKKLLNQFYYQGFNNFEISVNYLKNKIINYLSKYKSIYNIRFIKEKKYLGTIGSLAFIQNTDLPIIVMNSDLLTNIDFKDVINFHNKTKSDLTICAKSFNYSLPYGEIQFKNKKFFKLVEKPIKPHLINSGIYVVKPKIIKYIIKGKPLMMNNFINTLNKKKKKISIYPIFEEWSDIGDKKEYLKQK